LFSFLLCHIVCPWWWWAARRNMLDLFNFKSWLFSVFRTHNLGVGSYITHWLIFVLEKELPSLNSVFKELTKDKAAIKRHVQQHDTRRNICLLTTTAFKLGSSPAIKLWGPYT
jgi:hypothetical protein